MKIAVIGTGYVGLVSGTGFAEIGHTVICLDIDPKKVENLRNGIMPIHEEGLEEMVKRHVAQQTLSFTTDYAVALEEAELIFIAVGTPSAEDGTADLRFVVQAAESIGKHLNQYAVIVDKSTVPVGTSDLVKKTIEGVTSIPFDVVSNPEILREGVAVSDFMNPSRIIIGSSSTKATEKMLELYAPLPCQKLIMSPRSAELSKYAANAFLATKISYINELARYAEHVDASIEDVALGIGTDPRIGKDFLKPGPGWGGSCFPKDVKALVHMTHSVGLEIPIVEAALHSNQTMKEHIVKRLSDALGGLQHKTIGVLGISFKAKTDDVRDSPALDIIQRLVFNGAQVKAYDPIAIESAEEKSHLFTRCASIDECAQQADALVIATEWDEFKHLDLVEIKKSMRGSILFDARNLLQPSDQRLKDFTYLRIGSR